MGLYDILMKTGHRFRNLIILVIIAALIWNRVFREGDGDAGGVECTPPLEFCSTTGQCENFDTSKMCCGGPGVECTLCNLCEDGECIPDPLLPDLCMPEGMPGCYNLQTDESNCGTCGNVCQASCSICEDGECILNPLSPDLCGVPGEGPVCVNLQIDESHCGICNNLCPTGVNCVAGICEIILSGPASVPIKSEASTDSVLNVTFDITGVTGLTGPLDFKIQRFSTFNATVKDSEVAATLQTGSTVIYEASFIGLVPGTTYFFKSFIANANDSKVSGMASIKAGVNLSGPATVPIESDDTGTSLKVTFDITGVTGTPTVFKIQRFASLQATEKDSEVEATLREGSTVIYEYNFTGLISNTTYYFKSYIANVSDAKISNMASLTTKPLLSGPPSIPILSNKPADLIQVPNELKVIFNVTGITGGPIISHKIQKFSSNSVNAVKDSEESATLDGRYTNYTTYVYNFTSLPVQTFYFKSYIENATGDSKLSDFSAPFLVTAPN